MCILLYVNYTTVRLLLKKKKVVSEQQKSRKQEQLQYLLLIQQPQCFPSTSSAHSGPLGGMQAYSDQCLQS